MREALDVLPHAAPLWVYLGQSQGALGEHAEAARSLARAAELDPSVPQFRLVLAQELAAAGDLGGAEAQFRSLVRDAPSEPIAHFALAAFLGGHRPGQLPEALAEAGRAASLPGRPGGVPQAQIEALLRSLRARAATQPKTEPARSNDEETRAPPFRPGP